MARPIVLLIPVLRRPWRVAPLVESIEAATPGPHRTLFLTTEDDVDEIASVEAAGLEPLILSGPRRPGDYARKINAGYHASDEPLMLLGADDLAFHPGWHEAVCTAAGTRFGVVGTQDLGNPRVIARAHSTHPVVARWYADQRGTVDGPGRVLSEEYQHNFVDDELVGTAKNRNEWTFADGAVVEHLHFHWYKSSNDPTYELGLSTFDEDREMFLRRRHRWSL